MTTHELFDRLQTWNMLFEQIPLPSFNNPTAQQLKLEVERQWDNGMLHNASELEVIDDIKNTPIETDLRTAIEYAKSGDRTKLKEIRSFLQNVQKYMFENRLT